MDWFNRRVTQIIWGSAVFLCALGQAEYRSANGLPVRRLIQIAASYGYTNALSDNVTGASYSEKMTNPIVGELSAGMFVYRGLYLGARYEYWYARRNMVVAGSSTIDNLRYQIASGEVGWGWGNPRVLWLITGTVGYPVQSSIESSSGSYLPDSLNLAYELRAYVGIRLASSVFLMLSGGYRYRDLGSLSVGSTPYISGGQRLLLSGPFAAIGLGLSL